MTKGYHDVEEFYKEDKVVLQEKIKDAMNQIRERVITTSFQSNPNKYIESNFEIEKIFENLEEWLKQMKDVEPEFSEILNKYFWKLF